MLDPGRRSQPRAPKQVKRQYIQMIAAARQGDPVACRELGLRYLHGRDGFPRHQRIALAYLTCPAAGATPEAARILVEGMTLEDLVLTGHEATLRQVAVSGSRLAQIKLAAWLLIRHGDSGYARTWLSVAAENGNAVACESLTTLQTQGSERASFHLLTVHCGATGSDVARLNAIAARKALEAREPNDAIRCLRCVAALDTPLTLDLVETTLAILELASTGDLAMELLSTSWIESCLHWASDRGSPMAHYFLGRAMCGISSGRLEPRQLTRHLNLRSGGALLLRSADSGIDDAWLHLYFLHAAPRSSVVNPPLARVFLEKADVGGTERHSAYWVHCCCPKLSISARRSMRSTGCTKRQEPAIRKQQSC